MRRVGWVCIWLLAAFQGYAQTWAKQLDSLVRSSELLNTSEVGIAVFNLTKNEPVYSWQDQKLYRPASVEKIITSVTALAELGIGYTFDTRLAYTGHIGGDSILRGDLYVVGGFDPEFMEDDLHKLVEAVRQAGIRTIDGKLVGDVSVMDSVYWGAGWAWDDTPYSFQPYLSPLMLNRGCVSVSVRPAQKGSRPEVEILPRSDYYTVENRAVSGIPHAGNLKITRDWMHNGNTIRIMGNATRACTQILNLFSPQDFFLHTFRCRLAEKGIQVEETAYGVSSDEETIPIYTFSRPMEAVLKQALKKSDNLSAEALFYHLAIGKTNKKRIGSKDARKVAARFMKQAIGRKPDAYSIVDGSGISMYNYVSPELLLDYLKYAYAHQDIFQAFYEALPIAGVDGTLRYRMKNGKTFRNVRAKTGTVKGVSSLAGYVCASNGDRLAFVIINQNMLQARKARNFQDKICEILAQ